MRRLLLLLHRTRKVEPDPGGFKVLLENGTDKLLMETGDKLLTG